MAIPLIDWVVQSPIYPKQPGALFSLLTSELSVFRKFLQSRRVGIHAPCTSVRKNHLKQKIQHLQLCRKATPIIILRNIKKHVFKTNTNHPEKKKNMLVKQSSCEKPRRLRFFAKNSHGKFLGNTTTPRSTTPTTTTTPFSQTHGFCIKPSGHHHGTFFPVDGFHYPRPALQRDTVPSCDLGPSSHRGAVGNWGPHLEDGGSHLGGYNPDL